MRVDILVLFLILGGMCIKNHTKCDISCRFFIGVLHQIKEIHFLPNLLRPFLFLNDEQVVDFIKTVMVFILYSVNVVNYINEFECSNNLAFLG